MPGQSELTFAARYAARRKCQLPLIRVSFGGKARFAGWLK